MKQINRLFNYQLENKNNKLRYYLNNWFKSDKIRRDFKILFKLRKTKTVFIFLSLNILDGEY